MNSAIIDWVDGNTDAEWKCSLQKLLYLLIILLYVTIVVGDKDARNNEEATDRRVVAELMLVELQAKGQVNEPSERRSEITSHR
ncbi:hypothetical protein SNE40_022556 [Patella caerulea]|uniref:Uncharacterized protein n=1 Tax=Patella caerulea TaxID=87958 RepID=A0AAN8G5P5_PATCE